jgi:hypothetical protein
MQFAIESTHFHFTPNKNKTIKILMAIVLLKTYVEKE